MGFGLVIGYTEHLQNAATNNYDSLTELRTLRVTVDFFSFLGWSETESIWYVGHYLAYCTSP
jgi:hypothetical protein